MQSWESALVIYKSMHEHAAVTCIYSLLVAKVDAAHAALQNRCSSWPAPYSFLTILCFCLLRVHLLMPWVMAIHKGTRPTCDFLSSLSVVGCHLVTKSVAWAWKFSSALQIWCSAIFIHRFTLSNWLTRNAHTLRSYKCAANPIYFESIG